jgi:hypothetical protein
MKTQMTRLAVVDQKLADANQVESLAADMKKRTALTT